MRAEADRLQREVDRLTARIEQLRRVADAVDSLDSNAPLTSDVSYATDKGMASTIATKPPGPTPGDGAASKLMRELGMSSLSELARELKESHVTVRSWNNADRRIPDRVADKIKRLRERRAGRE